MRIFSRFFPAGGVLYRGYLYTLMPTLVAIAGLGLYLWLGAGEAEIALIGSLILLLGLAVTLLGIAGWLHQLARPLTILNNAMQSVRDGELSVRVREISGGEIGALDPGFRFHAYSFLSSCDSFFFIASAVPLPRS